MSRLLNCPQRVRHSRPNGRVWLRLVGAMVLASSTPTLSQTPSSADSTDRVEVSVPSGDAGVVVSVVDERGAPLPDAEVSLRLGEAPERLVLHTNAEGQVDVRGIASGEWQVDVRREGFMLFNAYVLLEPGKKPKIAFSSRQRTGSYWEPLQAVFLPPGIDLSPGVASGRESVRRAQQRADKASKDARRQQRRVERAANRGRLARVIPSEPVEPVITDLVEPKSVTTTDQSTANPAKTGEEQDGTQQVGTEQVDTAQVDTAQVDTAQVDTAQGDNEPSRTEVGGQSATSVPDPVTDSMPADAEAPETAAPAPSVALRTGDTQVAATEPPAAAPTPEAPATPSTTARSTSPARESAPTDQSRLRGPASEPEAGEPESYPTLTPAPRLIRNPRLLPAGACPECAAGEYSVATLGQAEKFQRGDRCSIATLDQIEALMPRVNGALVDTLSGFAGSLVESNNNDVLRLLPVELRSAIRSVLEGEARSCQLVGVILPEGSRYIGFRYQAGERSVMAECLDVAADGSQNCQVGDARWLAPPRVIKTGGVTGVFGVFENRSKRSTRLPRLVAYFAPARGWLPPSR